MLEILSIQPSAKANRTEKSGVADDPKVKDDRDRSEPDFESAYASDAEKEAKSAGEDDTARSPAPEENAAASEKSREAEVEEADPVVTFEAEALPEEELPVPSPKTGTEDKVAAEKGAQKGGAATSELVFAQRVFTEQRSTATNDPTTVSAPPVARETSTQPVILQATKANVTPAPETGSNSVPKVTAIQTDADGSAPTTASSKTAQALETTAPATSIPQRKVDIEAIGPRAEARSKADAERDRAPKDVAVQQNTNAKPSVTMATTQVPTAPHPFMPLTAQSDTSSLDAAMPPIGDVDTPTSWDPRSVAPNTLAQTLSRPETPGMIGRQIAEILQRLPDRPVELSLNPEELGRVRLSISTAEGGITVHVLAERPETLDLMRRHIDLLGREFQALGYESINFAFNEGQSERDTGTNSDESASNPANSVVGEQQEDPATPITMAPSTGVDLRL
ncbi:flagellar hook-length control protein FliK [uncultured Roseobacter sp.]|uniref:flagellar hook-length control protein FliK n=1 Tax=uncultured Roseobacter sp. TaxID=114847 RepID=UPI002609E4FF|nr:flagellar hook-length control protein FliK [uncultured Roseobacter sp.]